MATTPSTYSPADARRDTVDPAGMRVIWLLLVAAFVAILNETTMGIAIPHLNQDLGLPPELGQWMTSAFMLTMAVVIPTTGFLLQRFTTRQVFIAAMAAFLAGTTLAMLAPGFAVLLAGRVVQASGTGVMLPLLMTTVMNVVPAGMRGRMMGRISLVIALAPAIGPTLAGAILEALHWRWIFGIVLVVALGAFTIGVKWMTDLGVTTKAPIDVASIALSALAFGGIVFGLSQFGGEGAVETDVTDTLDPRTLGTICLAIGMVILVLFGWRQLALQKDDRALLDLRVFRSGNFAISVAVMTILAMAMFGTLTLLPLYLQDVVGLNALQAGLILLPGSILMGLLGPLFGRVYDRWGPRVLLIPGTGLVTTALFAYSTVTESTSWPILLATQITLAIGMALSFTPLFSAALGSLEPRLYSHGSAVLNTLQQVGGAAGVAVLIATYSTILRADQAAGATVAAAGSSGAGTAFLIAGVVALFAIVGACFIRKPQN